MKRLVYVVTGQVQGVGFRPFVYRCATMCALSGHVGNTPEGVRVEVQGSEARLEEFAALFCQLPPLARLTSQTCHEIPVLPGETGFRIVSSEEGKHKGHRVLVSPDMAVCDACLADMRNPENRRFGYAFTNCTDCGPRYTITRSIPYDRPGTSMACFPLCASCQQEYEDPLNRRFHAQPNACPDCGPDVWLEYGPATASHNDHAGFASLLGAGQRLHGVSAILALLAELKRGRLVAIKGLGGFHLACDATNTQAVRELRQRKNRPHKALAIMVRDVESARRFVQVNEQTKAALLSPRRPIVVCPRLPQHSAELSSAFAPVPSLPKELAPDTQDIGVMLPYTPLHFLLFNPALALAALRKQNMDLAVLLGKQLWPEMTKSAEIPFQLPDDLADEICPALVMTSGNAGGEPICLGNREAKKRLKDIADVFLLHNRDILVRVDDSVLFASSSPCPVDAPSSPHLEPIRNERPRLENHTENTSKPMRSLESPANESAPPPMLLRRARGFVPEALTLSCPTAEQGPDCVLGMGAQLKHTFCLTRRQEAFVSQHIGDLENPAALDFFEETLRHLGGLLEVRPDLVVRDLHPDYPSSRMAESLAIRLGQEQQREVPLVSLQHHYAHIHAVLAEHGRHEPSLGLALDGSGMGEDGVIWGGELLWVSPEDCALPRKSASLGTPVTPCPSEKMLLEGALQTPLPAGMYGGKKAESSLLSLKEQMRGGHARLGHFAPFAMPGGESAIREPWRLAESLLFSLDMPSPFSDAAFAASNIKSAPVTMVRELLRRGTHCPSTTSCGRLFDAVAALCDLCPVTSYEGQAAIRLEAAQDKSATGAYDAPIRELTHESGDSLLLLDTRHLFREAAQDKLAGVSAAVVARRFHVGLAHALADWARAAADRCGVSSVVLAGGVLNNRTLAFLLPQALHERGLHAILPRLYPAGDGAISLGQAAWGRLVARRHPR